MTITHHRDRSATYKAKTMTTEDTKPLTPKEVGRDTHVKCECGCGDCRDCDGTQCCEAHILWE